MSKIWRHRYINVAEKLIGKNPKNIPDKSKIVVATVPDFSVTLRGKTYNVGFDISKAIDVFNSIVKDEAGKRNTLQTSIQFQRKCPTQLWFGLTACILLLKNMNCGKRLFIRLPMNY